MTRRMIGGRARRAAAWSAALVVTAIACGEPGTRADASADAQVDAALARDLQLAAAAAVELAAPRAPESVGRFLGVAERPEVERAAPAAARAVRPARRAARAAATAPAPAPAVVAVAAEALAPAPTPAPAPAPEPEPERLVRYAVGDGLDAAYGVGVVLRGGRVGEDDKCEAELPRPRVPTTSVIRTAPTVTLRDAWPARGAMRTGAPVGRALPPF